MSTVTSYFLNSDGKIQKDSRVMKDGKLGELCLRCHQSFITTVEAKKMYGFARPYQNDPVDAIVLPGSDICYHCVWREIDLVKMYGLTDVLALGTKIGYSELGIHCQIAEKIGIYARRHPDELNYAFVLDEDGRWTQGSFYYFGEGRFSLS